MILHVACPGFVALTHMSLRIVEYATRDQAQNAVNSLSNQNLMGRLVYVREVGPSSAPRSSAQLENLPTRFS